jgi:hypothetical protein
VIGRQLVQTLTRRPDTTRTALTLQRPPRRADAHPLRACACDVDLTVFGHTQCQEAGVPWPADPQAHPQ